MPPIEWLLQIVQTEDGYHNLLSDAGGLAKAAWKLARARCQVAPTPTKVPSRIELGAAAREIASRVGWHTPVPTPTMLALDCEADGLPVL